MSYGSKNAVTASFISNLDTLLTAVYRGPPFYFIDSSFRMLDDSLIDIAVEDRLLRFQMNCLLRFIHFLV